MGEKHFTEQEKNIVLNWMKERCCGRGNAKLRERILPFMPLFIPDRKWRWIISELITEGLIYSSASFGYFFMPLTFPSASDIVAAKHAILERKNKALSTLENCDKNLKYVESLGQGQREFV